MHSVIRLILFHTDTFHVQNMSTSVFQSKDCVTCTFAEGTTAIGCHIRFVDTTGNTTAKETDAPRPEGTLSAIGCVGDLPPGVYRVLAFDISSSGVVDDRVAAVGESLVTVTEKYLPSAVIPTHFPSTTGFVYPLALIIVVILTFVLPAVIILTTTDLESPTHASVTPGADSTKYTQPDKTLLLPLIATVTGISVLAAGVMIIMVACLVRYRAKARRHKIGEDLTHEHVYQLSGTLPPVYTAPNA